MRPNKAQRIAAAALENDKHLAQQITSIAIALEALETLLVAEGILTDGDLMAQIKGLIELKQRNFDASQQV